jgi:hypothetical protein
MTRNGTRNDPPRTLPAERAFVVHFATAARRGQRFAGRVEHLTSGTSAQFSSRAALWAFFAELLDASRR